jgi:membrane protein YqaA with SNARE-associated domain
MLVLIAVQRPEVAWLCASLAVLGSVLGNTVLFWTARRGGRRFMSAATPQGRSGRFREWFRRYGLVTVFVPALVPIPLPLKVFVISAAVTGTSFSEFLGVILLARSFRYFGAAWLGVRLGTGSGAFLKSHTLDFTVVALLLFVGLYGWIRWKDRRRARS